MKNIGIIDGILINFLNLEVFIVIWVVYMTDMRIKYWGVRGSIPSPLDTPGVREKEVALMIGDILRSCKVRRGIGTIRQDVNISIMNEERVEIKGMQDMDIFIKAIENEVLRQESLRNLSKKVPSFLNSEIKELKLKSKVDWIESAIKDGASIVGFRLGGFQGLLGAQLFKGYRLGTDLAKYAKVRGFGGVIHSDEDLKKKYGFTLDDIKYIQKTLKLEDDDAFILVVGDRDKAFSMFAEILFPRIRDLKNGVLKEVRNAVKDSTTEFLRPMSGSARMYPETDLPLLKISRDMVNRVKSDLPKLRSELELELRNQGISPEIIKSIFKMGLFFEYKDLYTVYNHPKLVAKVLTTILKDIAARLDITYEDIRGTLHLDTLGFVLNAVKDGLLDESDIKSAFERIMNGEKLEKAIKFTKADIGDVEERVMNIIKSKPGLRPNAYMGLIMSEFKGAVDGKTAMKLIDKYA